MWSLVGDGRGATKGCGLEVRVSAFAHHGHRFGPSLALETSAFSRRPEGIV